MFGRRPVATSRSVPWMVSLSGARQHDLDPLTQPPHPLDLDLLRIVMPSRANASSTMAVHSGSSLPSG